MPVRIGVLALQVRVGVRVRAGSRVAWGRSARGRGVRVRVRVRVPPAARVPASPRVGDVRL